MRNYDLLIKVLLEGPLWNLAIYIFVCKDNVQHLHLNGTLIVSENGEALIYLIIIFNNYAFIRMICSLRKKSFHLLASSHIFWVLFRVYGLMGILPYG